MKKIICSLSFIVLTMVSNVYSMQYEPGPYLGGQIGWGKISEGDAYRVKVNASEKGTFSSLGWRGYIGYSFIPFFSIETGYSYFDDNTYTNSPAKINVKGYTVDLVGKITLPIGMFIKPLDHFSIYGKGGAAYINSKTDSNISKRQWVSTIMPAFGAGLVYNFTDNIAVDASWSCVLGRNYINNQADIGSTNPVPRFNLFTLGLSYKITGIF